MEPPTGHTTDNTSVFPVSLEEKSDRDVSLEKHRRRRTTKRSLARASANVTVFLKRGTQTPRRGKKFKAVQGGEKRPSPKDHKDSKDLKNKAMSAFVVDVLDVLEVPGVRLE